MITDTVYRIAHIEDETDLHRQVREDQGKELIKKWEQLQIWIENFGHKRRLAGEVEKKKIEQDLIHQQLIALNFEKGDVWDDYNEEAPYRRMMESRAQARESEMMAYYGEDDEDYEPEDDVDD